MATIAAPLGRSRGGGDAEDLAGAHELSAAGLKGISSSMSSLVSMQARHGEGAPDGQGHAHSAPTRPDASRALGVKPRDET